MRAKDIGKLVMSAGLLSACSTPQNTVNPDNAANSGTLRPFSSTSELSEFIKRKSNPPRRDRFEAVEDGAVIVTAAAPEAEARSENITNRQESDVDEGGIVKNYGDYLVILRRGRLFTVSVASGDMKPISHINAFPPGESGRGAWYDEMLIHKDQVIVIGYSYARGGTEVNRFRIGSEGQLSYVDSYHLKSNDYYSSRNYASRLVDGKLVFYTPIPFWNEDWDKRLPAVRRWNNDKDGAFEPLTQPKEVYVAQPVRVDSEARVDMFHSVTSCDLNRAEFDCNATTVVGGYSRNFYVSGRAVYVWASSGIRNKDGSDGSILYRMPLSGGAPSAVVTQGSPVDQFSFREDRDKNQLNVVVRANGGGDAMWSPEVTRGDAALLQLPISDFNDGSTKALPGQYRNLPMPEESWSFVNRFVGDHLLYSAGRHAPRVAQSQVYTVLLAAGDAKPVSVPHGVGRIDIIGKDAIVIGNDDENALGFSSVLLGDNSRAGTTFKFPKASEGENRSHAFFFKPESRDGSSGYLGLPVRRKLGRDAARFLGSGSAILFLQRKPSSFNLAGELEANAENARDDGCQASCVDWYGNARPIFLGNRVFALMGYELVEGIRKGGKITETSRIDFAPKTRQ